MWDVVFGSNLYLVKSVFFLFIQHLTDKRGPNAIDTPQTASPPPPPPPSNDGNQHPSNTGNPKTAGVSQRFHPYQRAGANEKADPRLLRRQNSENSVKQAPTDPRQRGNTTSQPSVQPKPPQVNSSRDPRRR